jgi:hypothetical protein
MMLAVSLVVLPIEGDSKILAVFLKVSVRGTLRYIIERESSVRRFFNQSVFSVMKLTFFFIFLF